MERRQLRLLRNAHAHALARRLQERLDLAPRPAGESGRGERVVVERAAPDRGAAVVARAAADHRGARELDAPAAIAVVGGVAALVRLGQPGGVEHVGRPAPVGVAAEVGTGLEHEDGLVRALGEQAGERGARRASPDDQRVDAVRQRLHAHKATRCGRNICESAQVSGALLSGDSIRLNQAMAIARHKTRQRELREARALVRRVQRGDARAFELLYATYEGRIYRFCHRLTGRAETAAALVELTFARAFANLPEGGLETLDVPAYLYATARTLAFERNGEPLGSRGAAESEVSVANERLSAQERAVLALRDLERRPDDEIAAALDVDEADVPGLVGAARLHLLAELRPHGIADPCPGRLADLSAHADGMLPAERRAELETHVASCADCRATLFGLREAALRYRSLPVPEPRASWGRASRARSAWLACPAERRLPTPWRAGGRPDRPPPWQWGDSRSSGWESRSRPRNGTATARSRLARRPRRLRSPWPSPTRRRPAPVWRPASSPSSRRGLSARRPRSTMSARAPGGSHRRASRRRIPPSCRASEGHSRPVRRPCDAASPSAGRSCHSRHDPKPERKIPVEIVPPVAPSHAQAASDAAPPPQPPPAPEPPPPPQTTTP